MFSLTPINHSALQVIEEYADLSSAEAWKRYEEMQNTFIDLKRAEGKYYGTGGQMFYEFKSWMYNGSTMEAQLEQMNPVDRLHWINEQMQIIKGIVPTPTGYSISPAEVKALKEEQKRLRHDVSS